MIWIGVGCVVWLGLVIFFVNLGHEARQGDRELALARLQARDERR